MSHDVKYCAKQLKALVGGKIVSVIESDDGESFGFRTTKGDQLYDVWIDRDSEGNGPGWVSVERPIGSLDHQSRRGKMPPSR